MNWPATTLFDFIERKLKYLFAIGNIEADQDNNAIQFHRPIIKANMHSAWNLHYPLINSRLEPILPSI